MNSRTASTLISIVIPVYNAEGTIKNLVERIIDEFNKDQSLELEIVLTNDGSTDRSEEACINSYNKYKDKVKFISLSKNFGEHNAVMAGLNHVSGEQIVIMDDDFQNPISEVRKLISFAKNNKFDVVYTYYESKKHSPFRNLGSWFNDKVANVLLNKPRDLYLSSFKWMSRFLVNEVIKYDLPYPYIDGIIIRTTNNIGNLKVAHDSRKFGKSGYSLKKLVSLWSNMFTNFSILPLRFSIIIGVIFSGLGMVIAIIEIIGRILNPDLPQGYTAIIVAISIFSGVQLIAIGMIGEYVGRIFLSISRKPQYCIKKIYHSD